MPSNNIHLFEIILLLFKTDVRRSGWIWDFNQKAPRLVSQTVKSLEQLLIIKIMPSSYVLNSYTKIWYEHICIKCSWVFFIQLMNLSIVTDLETETHTEIPFIKKEISLTVIIYLTVALRGSRWERIVVLDMVHMWNKSFYLLFP